jgi:hypothetical protein
MSACLPSRSKPLASVSPAITVRALSPTADGKATSGEGGGVTGARRRLARPLEIERTWAPDREAMLATLRVVLGLPKVLPSSAGGGMA